MKIGLQPDSPVQNPEKLYRQRGFFAYLVLCAVAFVFLMLIAPSWAQPALETVNIQVHVDQSHGPLPPIWNYFGYDEPNYTYVPNGKKLLGELGPK